MDAEQQRNKKLQRKQKSEDKTGVLLGGHGAEHAAKAQAGAELANFLEATATFAFAGFFLLLLSASAHGLLLLLLFPVPARVVLARFVHGQLRIACRRALRDV